MEVDKVYKQLLKLGFSPNRIGTLYIAESIVYLSTSGDSLNRCIYLETTAYEFLTQKFNKNKYTIKSNILLACQDVSLKTHKTFTPKYTIERMLKYNLKKEGKKIHFELSKGA